MEISIQMVLAAVIFIAGMLFMKNKGGNLKEIFKREKEKTDGQSKYNAARLRIKILRMRERQKEQEAKVRDTVDSGHSDGDPVDDLRNKLDSYRRARPGKLAP